MRYKGDIYRPPSEARSYLLQVTYGCAHNKCTFCSMFRGKVFGIRPMEEILEDIHMAREAYHHVEKIFLCDGDALCLSTEKLLTILTTLKKEFPECRSINVYGTPKDVLRKSKKELRALKEGGIGIIYIGGESGNEEILKDIEKGATREEIIEAIKKIEESGIAASVTFISGLGGQDKWREHATDTGTMISESQPTYVGLLTLMIEPGTELYDQIHKGEFKVLSAEDVVEETLVLLENTFVDRTCIFRSNHASNYVSLRGNLPEDKDRMMGQLRAAKENQSTLKDERFRML